VRGRAQRAIRMVMVYARTISHCTSVSRHEGPRRRRVPARVQLIHQITIGSERRQYDAPHRRTPGRPRRFFPPTECRLSRPAGQPHPVSGGRPFTAMTPRPRASGSRRASGKCVRGRPADPAGECAIRPDTAGWRAIVSYSSNPRAGHLTFRSVPHSPRAPSR
jgi:hypothetical protein